MSRKQAADAIKDGECSPECLLSSVPVQDPYSSDEEKDSCRKPRNIRRPDSYKMPSNNPLPRKKIFKQKTFSCNITVDEFLFFFDMDFTLIEEEKDISDYSTEEVLRVVFMFISDSPSNEESKWKNKNISEIYKNAFKEIPVLSWITKNDTIDIKKYPKEYEKFEEKWKMLYQIETEHCDKKASYLHWLNIIKVLNKCSFEHHDVIKLSFYQIKEVADFPPFKGNGAAKYEFLYKIPTELASDDSNIFETRNVYVQVHPDSVFMVRGKEGLYDLIPKLVMEVYSPKDNNETKHDVDGVEEECSIGDITSVNNEEQQGKQVKNITQESHYYKPQRKKNGIYKEGYAEQARNYLSKRVPRGLVEGHCMKKLVAQHGLQLLTIALHDRQEKKNITVLGMFMKNEHIFFSKLCITKERLDELVGYLDSVRDITNPRTGKNIPPGIISYSSWSLDVTKPNHRIALLIFMREYLKTEHHF